MISGFFNDTDVYAEDFASFAAGILSDGVLADTESSLKITPSQGMTLSVSPGYCWIKGHFGKCEGEELVTIGPASGMYDRYDRIVARLNVSEAKVHITVIEGSASDSPTIPDIVRDGTYYDLGLAVVYIRAGALTISSNDITDTRSDSAVCGGALARTADRFVADSKLDISDVEKYYVNVGDVKATACPTAPEKWLICDGSAVERDKYRKLFGAIGTTYGSGDGSTTFNIPNLKGKVVVGIDSTDTAFNTIGKTGGEKTHKLTLDEMPSHSHGSSNYSLGQIPIEGNPGQLESGTTYRFTKSDTTTGSKGGDGAHNNLQPYMALNYIIYTGVAG